MLKLPGSVTSVPLFQHLAKFSRVLQTPGMLERKKEMSWTHVLSALWGAGNLFNG
jgi:hypothetical protein